MLVNVPLTFLFLLFVYEISFAFDLCVEVADVLEFRGGSAVVDCWVVLEDLLRSFTFS